MWNKNDTNDASMTIFHYTSSLRNKHARGKLMLWNKCQVPVVCELLRWCADWCWCPAVPTSHRPCHRYTSAVRRLRLSHYMHQTSAHFHKTNHTHTRLSALPRPLKRIGLNGELKHVFGLWVLTIVLVCRGKKGRTRMWVNAQHDGRPAEYRWRPLFNAAKFGWRPILECCAVTLPRHETRWNLHGCPKLLDQSKPLVGRSSPYCGNMWRRYCCLTSFFSDCQYVP